MRIKKAFIPATGLGTHFLIITRKKRDKKISTKLIAYLITFFVLAGCAQLNADETVARSETQQTIESTGKKISSYRTGHYRVIITRDKKNWYQISGQNTFILTQQCLINVTEREALLSLRKADNGGNGSLHFEREGCNVIGLFGSMRL